MTPKPTRLLTLAGALLLSTSLAHAQMSGNYSINGSKPTGGRSFKTFDAATKQLFIAGQSGPVTMTVTPGTYNESWLVLPSGSSTTRRLTFRGVLRGLSKLQSTGAITIFFPALTPKFQVSHVTLENLDYVTTGTASAHAILFAKGNKNHLIKNCTFGQGLRGAFFRGLIDCESTCRDIEITGCKFDTSPRLNSNFVIKTQGTPGMNIHHNEFIFNGGFTYGVSLWNSNSGRGDQTKHRNQHGL